MWQKRKTSDLTHVKARWIALLTAFGVAVACMLTGVAPRLEHDLRQLRDAVQASDASGQIAVVEVDGRSLQAVDSWPWPRSIYADALEELEQLGAAEIAFDLDFSSRADAADDRILAEKLKEMGGSVILPTFRQVNQADGPNSVTETKPLPEFAEHAFLAAVNVHPGADGTVALYPYGVTTSGTARPSLASMIAGKAGHIDESFRIDQAIDPGTIPRISFIDLLEGHVARDRVEGRHIVIGATAIELGDRYPTGLYGVIPGVFIQAQAAETLLQDRVRRDLSKWFVLAVAGVLLLACAAHPRTSPNLRVSGLAILGLTIGLAMVLDAFRATYVPLGPIVVLIAAFEIALLALRTAIKLRDARETDTMSGLPNRTAMVHYRDKLDNPMVVVARIADVEQLEALLSSHWYFKIDQGLAERLKLLAVGEKIFRLERGLFGWFIPAEHEGDLDEYFATVRTMLNAPLAVEEQQIKLAANLGVCRHVIAKAAAASEFAHKTGIFWSDQAEDLQVQSQGTQRILIELDEALENGAIWVAYQPKYSFASKTVSGAECLVRWTSPVMGRIGPDEFIPVLESKRRMDALTLFVLRDALAHLTDRKRGDQPLNLAINVSAQLLSDADFVDEMVALIAQAELSETKQLTIEVTESAPLSDAGVARQALDKISEAGARISIDDYGTGQATLTYLQGFPADEVKIDQSFVKNFTSSKADEIMVRSTIEMAHALGFQIVAEGIEDGDILEALAGLGCDYGQGWHIGKPVPWDEFAKTHLGGEEKLTAAA